MSDPKENTNTTNDEQRSEEPIKEKSDFWGFLFLLLLAAPFLFKWGLKKISKGLRRK